MGEKPVQAFLHLKISVKTQFDERANSHPMDTRTVEDKWLYSLPNRALETGNLHFCLSCASSSRRHNLTMTNSNIKESISSGCEF